MAATTLRIPITNIYGGGDYTAPITIGSQGAVANVILDTGSSTLAVVPRVYDPSADSSAQPTPLAQDVIYGTGGWTGPVLTTSVSMGTGSQSMSADVNIAITDEQETGNFGSADGILGLAFNSLNQAYNLQTYLQVVAMVSISAAVNASSGWYFAGAFVVYGAALWWYGRAWDRGVIA